MRKTYTFYQLFGRDSGGYNRVEIPIIQRDYAQGRSDENSSIVRKDFLNALLKALLLPPDDSRLPLDLDFVYGSVVNESFQPLDGQQRLTTLFLLHWWTAWMDDRIDEFQAHFAPVGQSRFGYEVRPSSRDFINELAKYRPEVAAIDCLDIRKMIWGQPWYFRSWQFDPTIQSVLLMLEQIHKCKDLCNPIGLYARLVDESAPAITFQLLDLKQFDLSDDLYIKMNARGKLLTPFETFKARFEEKLKTDDFANLRLALCGKTPVFEFFSHRIDNEWSDLFWRYKNEKTNTIDHAAMNLVRTVIMVTRSPENDSTNGHLADLRNASKVNSYAWFDNNSWLDEKMVVGLITLLERWGADFQQKQFRCYLPEGRYMDEKGEKGEEAFFKTVVKQAAKLSPPQLVQFAGYVQYLVHADGKEVVAEVFNNWMRVVFNLSVNKNYDRQDDLRSSIAGLRELHQYMDDIACRLASPKGHVQGFLGQQMAEERIKARLLRLGGDWPKRIYRSEQHHYFRGQIGFLLCFCGVNLDKPDKELTRLDAETVNALVAPFEHYSTCAAKMFDDLKNDPHGTGRLWERGCLAVGDYLLKIGQNKSLLTFGMDRDRSWKRLLRNAAVENSPQGQVLKKLWDQLDSPASFESDLLQIIESNSNIDPWRKVIVATPNVYSYGEFKMLRFSTYNSIYLLKRSQMNGMHAELFTYCVYQELQAAVESLSLKISYRETNSTDDQPGLCLMRRFGLTDVTFHLERHWRRGEDRYVLYLNEPQEPDDNLRVLLEENGFEETDEWLTKRVHRAEIKTAVQNLDRLLR